MPHLLVLVLSSCNTTFIEKHRPIAYASRTLNRGESNYSVTHQETLAEVWALKHFRDIITGYPITVFKDQAAVTELFFFFISCL